MDRIRIRVVGHSGYGGLLSAGNMIAKGLRRLGFHINADREYPSLIKGGTSCFTINASNTPIKALSNTADILIAIDKPNLEHYIDTLKDGGTLIYGYEKTESLSELISKAQGRGIKMLHLPAREIVKEAGGNSLMKNTVLLGMTWKTLGLELDGLHTLIKEQFAHKAKLIDPNLKCAQIGYERSDVSQKLEIPDQKPDKNLFIDGNYALALGAIHAGVRAYYAYPMSPSSSILTHMADHAADFNLVVKQAEDEITVANLTLGSMHAGTRALCATSGGGFDLMTETLSLAAIIEVPWVCVVVQRPGPATGLPTWTGQGDLQLAIRAGHGEFTRCVIAVSDPESAFELIQHALNIAEEFQIPVIVLSEKVIAESMVTSPVLTQNQIPIKRGLPNATQLQKLKNTDRYALTESGVSTRWIPGSSDATYFANGDEHNAEGLIDESEAAGDMYEKRCRKSTTLLQKLPEPTIHGSKKAVISFVGWGSTKNIMHDMIKIYKDQGIDINYLHYDYLWPLKTERLNTFFKENVNVHLIEGNHDGQLGQLIAEKTDLKFAGKLLKWNGRPFFVEDLEAYIDQHTQ